MSGASHVEALRCGMLCPMSQATCTHGLVQRLKYGTKQSDGLDVCLGCKLPTPESWQAKVATAPPPEPAAIVQARTARTRGAGFLEIQLEVAESSRDVRFGEADSGERTARDHGEILAAIESEGWRLEHVGYVFVPTGQSTRQKVLGTGESVAVSGVTVGFYLFRALAFESTTPAALRG